MSSKKAPVLIGPHNSATANWFHLNSYSASNHSSYSFAAFHDLVEKQILSKLKGDLETGQVNHRMLYVQDLQVLLTEKQFEESILSRPDEMTFPLITYHSTCDVTKINSILKYGYLLPGDNHPTKGYTVRMANGNLYGDGIYTSREFDLSKWYSFLDQNSSVQIIVNLLFPKRIKTVAFGDFKAIPSLSSSEGFYYEYDKKGNYHEYDTIISDDGKIFVSGNSLNVIPIALLKAGITQKHVLTAPNHPLFSQTRVVRYKCEAETNGNNVTIPCYQFFDDFHYIDTASYYLAAKKTNRKVVEQEIKHIFMVPPTVLSTTSLMNQLNTFIYSISSSPATDVKQEGSSPTVIRKFCSFYETHFHNIDPFNSFISFAAQSMEGKNSSLLSTDDILQGLQGLCHFLTNLPDSNDYYSPALQIVYLFVNNPNNADKLSEQIYQGKWKHYLKSQLIQFKIIFLNQQSVSTEIISLKSYFNSLDTYEMNYYYHIPIIPSFALKKSEKEELKISKTSSGTILSSYPPGLTLEEIFQIVYDEITAFYEQYDSFSLSYAVPYPLGIVGEGFFHSFQEQSVWDFTANTPGVVYKGFLEYIKINQNYYKIAYRSLSHENPAEILKKTKTKNSNVAVENKSKLDLFPSHCLLNFLNSILSLFLKFRNYIYTNPEHCSRYLPVIQQFYQRISQLLMDSYKQSKFTPGNNTVLSERTSVTDDIPTSSEKSISTHDLSVNELADRARKPTQLPLSTIKSYLYQLQKITSDVCYFGKLDLSTGWLEKLLKFKFQKKIIKRVKHDFSLKSPSLRAQFDKFYDFKPKEPADVLEIALDKTEYSGLMIRVIRAESSKVEPWLVKIDYISLEKTTIANIYCSAETEMTLRDSTGQLITDALVLPSILMKVKAESDGSTIDEPLAFVTNDDVIRLYYGYCFTRVPYLFMTSQLFALPVITWTAIISNCYTMILFNLFKKVPYDKVKFNSYMKLAFDLMPVVQQRSLCNQTVLEDILSHDQIESYLMESNNIPSIAKVLGVLTLPQSKDLILSQDNPVLKEKWNRLCFALLYETILRTCKAFIRSTNQINSTNEIIRESLGIHDQTTINDYSLNVQDTIKYSNRILLNRNLTNCSPFALMAVIQFIELFHQGKSIDEICDSFHKFEQIPKTFLLSHLSSDTEFINKIPLPVAKSSYLEQEQIPHSVFLTTSTGDTKKVKGPGKTQKIQAALFLQGMKYFRSKSRQGTEEAEGKEDIQSQQSHHQNILSLIYHPESVINEMIFEQLTFIQFKQSLSLSMKERIRRRYMKRLENALPYEEYHSGMPRLFTIPEIEEMNLSRPKENQLMLKPISTHQGELVTGLLYHHCCYPSCPMYLQNLASENDLKIMQKYPKERQFWKNQGLNQHLQNNQLLRLYIPGFHNTAKMFLQKTSRSREVGFEEFVIQMRSHYPEKVLSAHKGDLLLAFQIVYDSYSHK
jgi:hypothetical protein